MSNQDIDITDFPALCEVLQEGDSVTITCREDYEAYGLTPETVTALLLGGFILVEHSQDKLVITGDEAN